MEVFEDTTYAIRSIRNHQDENTQTRGVLDDQWLFDGNVAMRIINARGVRLVNTDTRIDPTESHPGHPTEVSMLYIYRMEPLSLCSPAADLSLVKKGGCLSNILFSTQQMLASEVSLEEDSFESRFLY